MIGRSALTGATGGPEPGPRLRTWPFVAREAEVRFLRRSLHEGDVRAVIVAGPPGVGKSRLAREAFAAEPTSVFATATTAAASIPFGCLSEVIPDPPPESTDRFSMFTAIGKRLAELGGGKRPALVIDDAHLLDLSGAALAFHLANVNAAFVCAIVRDGAVPPDAITALWKELDAPRLEVTELSPAHGLEVLERALGGPVDQHSAHALWAAAAGNLLFMRELVIAALGDGTLTRTEGIWRWSGRIPRSMRLAELVEAGIGRLSDSEREVLEVLALAEPLELGALEEFSAGERLADLERRGVIDIVMEEGRRAARFAHPLYGEVVRQSVPVSRAAAVRRRLADWVEARGMGRRSDLMRVATWRLDAEEPGDPLMFAEAARSATRAFDPELAVRLAEAARASGGGFPAALALGEALLAQNRFAAAEEALAPHAAEALAGGHARHYVFQRVLALHWGLGRSAEADLMLREARSARSDSRWRSQIDGLRAQVLAFDGPLDEAVALAAPIVAADDADRWARLYAVSAVATDLICDGRTDDALAVLGPYFDIALELAEGFPHGPAWITALHTTALAYAGRLGAAEEAMNGLLAMATSVGDEQARGGALVGSGVLALLRGELEPAERLLREAIAPLQASDLAGILPWAYFLLARTAGERGDGPAAAAALAQGEALAAQRPRQRLFAHDVLAGRAWAAASNGELSRAHRIVLEGAADPRALRLHRALTLVTALRLGVAPKDAATQLAEVARPAQSGLLRDYAAWAEALLDGSGSALAGAADTLAERGLALHAAEAHAAAAHAFAEEGRADSARRAAATSAGSLGPEPAARTPGLARVRTPELTAREREIAELAARGRTNAEIAEGLVVSVRTVEWHLQKAYNKLGIRSRSELGSVLGLDGIANGG